MNSRWPKKFFCLICILLLSACSSVPSPLQFGLDETVVRQALAFELTEKERFISQYLSISEPKLEINKIQIKSIKSIPIGNLSALKLEGDYNLTVKLPRQQATQKHNNFELYLQRQSEGKTWRLLKLDNQGTWLSYSIYIQ